MIKSLKIKGYRAFKEFEMTDLGRVNLLVGRNNTGKTSILEGLYILASDAAPIALWNVLARRGEQVTPEPQPNRPVQAEADISHLFHGHEIAPNTELSISTTNDKPAKSITYRIDMASPAEYVQLFSSVSDEGPISRLALWISGTPDYKLPPLPLSKLGLLRGDVLQHFLNLNFPPRKGESAAQLITSESLSINQILQGWNSIVLTPDEERVVAALRILEKNVERIAQVQVGAVQIFGGALPLPSRGGFFLRLKGSDKRIPIGSFGDGMWRMLALSVALVRARNSILLIDEIDTGFHYSVMSDMWKLVSEASELFNVQVFATTHSYDCVHSLASICEPSDAETGRITIQRIEPEKNKAVAFTGSQIKMVAERNIEVR